MAILKFCSLNKLIIKSQMKFDFVNKKQSGYANNGGHVWNVVNLDGVWSSVDVTWDDDAFTMNNMNFVTYTYFNAGAEIIGQTHSWESYAEIHPITETSTGTYFYYTGEANSQYFGFHSADLNSLCDYAAQQIINNDPFIYFKEDNFVTNSDEVAALISSYLQSYGYSASFSVNVQSLNDTCFVYIDAAAR